MRSPHTGMTVLGCVAILLLATAPTHAARSWASCSRMRTTRRRLPTGCTSRTSWIGPGSSNWGTRESCLRWDSRSTTTQRSSSSAPPTTPGRAAGVAVVKRGAAARDFRCEVRTGQRVNGHLLPCPIPLEFPGVLPSLGEIVESGGNGVPPATDRCRQSREKLARHYLGSFTMSGAEILFLLGYEDPNSFFRAFHTRTGQTPEQVRAAAS